MMKFMERDAESCFKVWSKCSRTMYGGRSLVSIRPPLGNGLRGRGMDENISVILRVRNEEEKITQCLEAVFSQSPEVA